MSADPRLVAVTGATGFLGRRLLPILAADGWRIRVLARGAPSPWPGIEPEVVRGDLADEGALSRLCDGADCVIHLAGLIKAKTPQDFHRANAAGAAAVAARLPAGAGLLLVSSLAAREPALSDYAASKRAGEDLCRKRLGDRLTVVRPPAVYGPGDLATLPLFRAALSSPVLPLLGSARARLALVHADDAARQIADLAAAPQPGTWALGGARPQGYSWREMMDTLCGVVGRHPAVVQAPAWFTRVAGAVSQAAGTLTGQAVVFNRGKAREMLHPDWAVGPGELAQGVSPSHFDLASGFADTLAWYRREGWIRAG